MHIIPDLGHVADLVTFELSTNERVEYGREFDDPADANALDQATAIGRGCRRQ